MKHGSCRERSQSTSQDENYGRIANFLLSKERLVIWEISTDGVSYLPGLAIDQTLAELRFWFEDNSACNLTTIACSK